jgi:undecaprenyl-diphosphatase
VIDPLQAIGLAFIQGITEFLPVSSSAHLVLAPSLLGWPDQGLAFDVAVHLGTLVAVVGYFRSDLWAIVRACLPINSVKGSVEGLALAKLLLVASLPVFAAGAVFEEVVETALRNPHVIATTTAVFGILLWAADRLGGRRRTLETLRWSDALLIGLAQAMALVPGVSRAGVTMTAARALGLDRRSAVRFSFLLAIPVILGASVFKAIDLVGSQQAMLWYVFGLGVVVSACSAWCVLVVFLRVIEKSGMLVFVLYRLLLAAFLFYWFQ